MYVTRPISLYRNSPSALSLHPPEGPNSGILVFQDEAEQPTCCFGLVKDNALRDLPFPQNTKLKLRYASGGGENRRVEHFYAVFIPVLDLPLSSAQYYVIKSRGRRKGEAYTSSREEDMSTCCFCRCVRDVPPKPFDPKNPYQQFEIGTVTCCGGRNGFVANSTAPDGFPPHFLRRSGWEAYTSTLHDFEPAEAPGLNSTLRARLPEFNFPLSCKSSDPVVVGKWYCPFIFIREGTAEAQMSKTMYYQMTLEQKWEEIFECENDGDGNSEVVDVSVRRQVVSVAGEEAMNSSVTDGFVWFSSFSHKQEGLSVGLSLAIVERVQWEQERVGFEWSQWTGDEAKNKHLKVKRTEEIGGMGEWRRFGCYVLVERFVLRRMDGSLVITWDFKHSHQVRCKWE